jgi:hypothetical protein
MRFWGWQRGVAIVVLACVMIAEVAVATSAGATLLLRNGAHPAGAVLSTTTLAIRPTTTTTSTTSTTTPTTTTVARPKPAPLPLPRPKPVVHAAVKPLATPKPQTAQLTVAPGPAGCPGALGGIRWPGSWHVVCEGGRSGLLGLTYPSGTTYLYVRAGESDSYLRIVALHEAGHAWDFARLNSAKIAQWCASRGCDAAHFFSGGGSSSGYREPGGAEDWASSWDACHGGSYHRSYLGLPAPSAAQCALQNQLTGY